MDEIRNYLENELKLAPQIVNESLEKLKRHPDIRMALIQWLESRVFLDKEGIVVEEYSAQDIHRLAPFMEGLGVFNFLITLREKPQQAHQYISEGFPRK